MTVLTEVQTRHNDLGAEFTMLLNAAGYIPADHDQPNYFPVALKPAYDEHRDIIPGIQRVVRTDTNQTLKTNVEERIDDDLRCCFARITEARLIVGARAEQQLVTPNMQIGVENWLPADEDRGQRKIPRVHSVWRKN